MDALKNYIPLIEDCLCNKITKQQFFDSCIPFFNMETFPAFILFKDQGKLTSINDPNSFVVKNKCLKESDSKGYILNFSPEKAVYNCSSNKLEKNNFLKSICFDTEKYTDFKIDNTLKENYDFLISNIDYEFKIGQSKNSKDEASSSSGELYLKYIPFYYFFLDEQDTFAPFIINNSKLANELFVIQKENNNSFVGISDDINIFNLSIFTYNYFPVLNIFHSIFKWYEGLDYDTKKNPKKLIEKKIELIESLGALFSPIQDFVLSIWNLYKFRKFISSMGTFNFYNKQCDQNTTKESCSDEKCEWNEEKNKCNGNKKYNLRKRYLDSQVSQCEFYCNQSTEKEDTFWDSDEYKNSPFNKPGKGPIFYEYKDIITDMANQVLSIGTSLCEISYSLSMPEYKYIFLTQILAYRMLKKKFLAGNWGFLFTKYISQLQTLRTETKSYNDLILIFKKSNIPKIYEYNKIKFMNVEYGNCMENTILQFLKLLFWDSKNKNYNLNLIQAIVRPSYRKFLSDFFEYIDKEKEQEYLIKWVKFISYDIVNDNSPPQITFNFINKGKDENGNEVSIELDATFDNLYNALIKLLNIDYTDNSKSEIEQINEFLDKNKTFIQNIENIKIFKNNNKDEATSDKLTINTYIPKIDDDEEKHIPFNMELWHRRHAYFKEALSTNGIYIIVNNFADLNVPIWDNLKNYTKPEFYKNFSQYVLLKIMFTPGQNNQNLFLYYQNTLSDEIRKSIYYSIFADLYSRKRDKIAEYNFNCIPEIIYDKLYIEAATGCDYFWGKITHNEQILKEFIKRQLFNYFLKYAYSEEVLINISKHEYMLKEIDSAWNDLELDKDVFDYEEFWNNVANYPQVIHNIINVDNKKIKENKYAERILVKIPYEDFWSKLGKNDQVLQIFTDISRNAINENNPYLNIWLDIILEKKAQIQRIHFWENVARNEKVVSELFELGIFARLLVTLTRKDFTDFWEILSENKIFLEHLREKNFWNSLYGQLPEDDYKNNGFWSSIAKKYPQLKNDSIASGYIKMDEYGRKFFKIKDDDDDDDNEEDNNNDVNNDDDDDDYSYRDRDEYSDIDD